MEIKVDKKTCTGCGLCKKACLYDAIDIIDGKAAINENCVFCGACVDVCRFNSIEISGIDEEEKDFSGYSGVCVYLEANGKTVSDVGFELVSKGRELAGKLGVKLTALAVGSGIKESAMEAFDYGLDKLYLADSPVFSNNIDDIFSRILVKTIAKYKPEIFLAGATWFGRTLIPKVAAILRTGLTADCTGLEIDEEKKILLQTRPTFGGNILATIITRNVRPQMATVRPHVMEKKKNKGSSKNYEDRIEHIKVERSEFKTEYNLIGVDRELNENINITDYDVVVSGGRGLGGSEKFSMLEELAGLLGGVVGASRAAVDSGWISYPHQVGQTGKTVNPKIYIACGISGAIQHLAGMQTSDIIIAVNKDPDASIFEVANYGVVGDLFEVVPMLIKRIKSGKPLI
ncbi:MAG: electron transfer flavoprotein subunit alpha [Actinomycetota bacterium]|nr:electron transfer flavoprotein subunit alpha [Actinomycetota bacterium]